MHTPLNRPVVLQLAGTSARVIPASWVSELEEIAGVVLSATQRIQDAETQCHENLASTLQTAWTRGYALGHAEALQKLRDYFEELDMIRQSVNQDLVSLVLEAVNKIVRGLPPQLVTESLVESALDEAQDQRGRLVLRVHPTRADDAERWLREQAADMHQPPRVMVEVDASMGVDDCMLETPAGRIDAGLKTQLEALKVLFRLPSAKEGAAA
jgi:flagellar assembly protein FliH